MMSKYNVGQVVTVGCDSGFCHDASYPISEIIRRFDSQTGKEYQVLVIAGQEFDGRTGLAITPPLAYFIKR